MVDKRDDPRQPFTFDAFERSRFGHEPGPSWTMLAVVAGIVIALLAVTTVGHRAF